MWGHACVYIRFFSIQFYGKGNKIDDNFDPVTCSISFMCVTMATFFILVNVS